MQNLLKLFFLLIFFTPALFANMTIEENKGVYENFSMQYFHDESSSLDFNTIKTKSFTNNTSNKFSLGYLKGSVWLRFKLKNNSSEERFVFFLNESFYNLANLYYEDETGLRVHKNGLAIPLELRTIKQKSPAFALNIKPQQEQVFYLELETKFTKMGAFSIYKEKSFFSKSLFSINTVYIFNFGMLSILILFNLFLYLKLKEKIYLYYVSYVGLYAAYLMVMSGFFVYLSLEAFLYKMAALNGLISTFFILFSKEFLQLNVYLPRINRFLKWLALYFVFLAVMVFVYYEPWNKVVNNSFTLTFLFLLAIAVLTFFKGHKKSSLYLLAMLIYLVCIVFYTMMLSGNLPYTNFTRYAFVVGVIVEMLIFALMLANRYHEMQAQTIQTQQELLRLKEKNEHYLEEQVQTRTKALKEANHKLSSLIEERELLLREVFHRVKNNFQVLISMLWFESKKHQESKQSYLELINRTKSMSSVHESLYDAENLNIINTKQYLSKIINDVRSIYSTKDLEIQESVQPLEIEFSVALSLGVIVNELLNNAIKYHQGTPKCCVVLCFRQEKEQLCLEVKDNGEGFDLENSKKGLGLRLVEEFSKKLPESEYKYSTLKGTVFKLCFNAGVA